MAETTIEEIRKVRSQITPSPWFAWYTPDGRIGSTVTNQPVCDADNWRSEWRENQSFIANAPRYIDFLLAEVDRLKAEVAELRNPDALTSYEREQTRPTP